jgi:hypothetical protein
LAVKTQARLQDKARTARHKTTSSFLAIDFFLLDIKRSPGNAFKQNVFQFSDCSIPHKTAFVIPKAGNTNNHTGQPSEITPA